jgi:hypothetical protein
MPRKPSKMPRTGRAVNKPIKVNAKPGKKKGVHSVTELAKKIKARKKANRAALKY